MPAGAVSRVPDLARGDLGPDPVHRAQPAGRSEPAHGQSPATSASCARRWAPNRRRTRGRPFEPGGPNIARVYDRWLGGKDNYAADRYVADTVAAQFPEVALVARANRQFVARAVAHVAFKGITQFIDVGAGLPATPGVDAIARKAQPGARVAYVDNDPVVLCHARALLAGGPGVAVVAGDMRQPGAILGSPELRGLIDLAPAGVRDPRLGTALRHRCRGRRGRGRVHRGDGAGQLPGLLGRDVDRDQPGADRPAASRLPGHHGGHRPAPRPRSPPTSMAWTWSRPA